MIGNILGNRYEILEKIGEGGMAKVYKAKCNILNRYVSVKILKEEFSKDKDFVDKFKSEALAVASLSNNNIVNIYDVGSEADINYIVMEYIDGKTLKEVIKESGRIEYSRAITIAIQIAKALECAHKNNIIHRDVKPQNILVTKEGLIKVTDFGIARASTLNTITNSNKVVGSAHYFSPEQAKGSLVDARTDIYSLGIVLYEMVIGKVPYDADSPVTVALKHIQETVVPPIDINHYIPKSLNDLILKAIEKDPIQRYQTMKNMLLDLETIKDNPEYKIEMANFDDDNTTIMEAVSPETPSVKKKISKKTKIIIISSVAAFLIILITAIVIFAATNKPVSTDVKIPKLIGLDEAVAKKAVTDLHLNFVEAGKEKSDAPKGSITKVFPDEGTTVKANTDVRVYVSDGGIAIKVNDYTNMDIAQAKIIISDDGFTLGTPIEKFDESQKGNVIDQTPKPDTAGTKATVIILTVSKGPEILLSQVPKVMGQTVDTATQTLINVKLKIGKILTVYTTDPSQNNIITLQSIPENAPNIKQGTAVDVTVSVYGIPDPKLFKTIGDYRAYIVGTLKIGDFSCVPALPDATPIDGNYTVITDKSNGQNAKGTDAAGVTKVTLINGPA